MQFIENWSEVITTSKRDQTDQYGCVTTLHYRPISRVVIGRELDYRSRLLYVRYCLTNTTLCL